MNSIWNFYIFRKRKNSCWQYKAWSINFIHKTAEISYFIGDKNYHKKVLEAKL